MFSLFLGTERRKPLVVDRFSSAFSHFSPPGPALCAGPSGKVERLRKLRCKWTDKNYQLSLQITHFFENNWLILTSAPSTKTSVQASPVAERSPTDFFRMFLTLALRTPGKIRPFFALRKSEEEKRKKSHSFGRMLSPGHCRRKNALPVSYYALFQGIAASKRTSWLFQHSHILFHLAFI